MEAVKKIEVGQNSYELHFDKKDKITVRLSKGVIQTNNLKIISMTVEPSENLLNGIVIDSKDDFEWTYENPHHYLPTEQMVVGKSQADKIRAALNIGNLAVFLKRRISILLHPDNLLWDENLVPQVIHRGLKDIVPPIEMESKDFLLRFKCLVIAINDSKYKFDDLYGGVLDSVRNTAFNKSVKNAQTIEELQDILRVAYKGEAERDLAMTVKLPRRKQKFQQRGFYVSTALAVVLAVVVAYFMIVRVPFDDKMQNSQTHFLSDNYDKVIDDLEEVKPKKLPKTEKYILATSYVNVDKLSTTQKQNVLKNVTLTTDENYLLFWIYDGRGDFDESLNLAKYINDDQLILYTYSKLYDQANENPKLSGTKKQQLLKKYQKQINKYAKKIGGAKNAISN